MTSEPGGPGTGGEHFAGAQGARENPIHAAPPWRGAMGGPEDGPYPMRFEVEYPERLSRWKALLRIFLLIPAAGYDTRAFVEELRQREVTPHVTPEHLPPSQRHRRADDSASRLRP